MKHHIVIYQGGRVVENMMSNIASPKELRARLAKKWPGRYSLYFRTVDPQHGWFSNHRGIYFWYIDSNPEKRQRKPEAIPERRLIRNNGLDDVFNAPIQNRYSLYEGDVFSVPSLKSVECKEQQIRPNSCVIRFYVKVQLNGRASWLNLQDLQYLGNSGNMYEALKFFARKTIKINKAVMLRKEPHVVRRGLLTGKPLLWVLRPIEWKQKAFEYEIIQ